jgi:plasmid maintenance system antidote protein VapI
MPTLQDIKKQRGFTNTAIGRALGVSASTAGMILQGRHIHTFHDEQIAQLADILGITFERCWYAMQESYEQFMGTPAPQQRADEFRYGVHCEMREQMPDLHITPEEPRQMAIVDGSVVVSPDRWIEERIKQLP